jgi:hypothetical protein
VASYRDGHRLVLHYLVYPLIIVATFLVVTLINARVLREAIYDAHTRDLGVTARVLANAVSPTAFADRPQAEAAIQRIAADTPIRVTIIAADGVVLADTHADVSQMDNHLRPTRSGPGPSGKPGAVHSSKQYSRGGSDLHRAAHLRRSIRGRQRRAGGSNSQRYDHRRRARPSGDSRPTGRHSGSGDASAGTRRRGIPLWGNQSSPAAPSPGRSRVRCGGS